MSSRRIGVRVVALLLVIAAFISMDAEAALPPGFTETNLPRPDGQPWEEAVGLTFSPSGRLFVWERGGDVWGIDSENPSTTRFLDIRDEVAAYRDHGMLGFALHPDFDHNGYVYVMYTVERHHLQNCDSPRDGAPVCGPSYVAGTHTPFQPTIGRVVRHRAVLPPGEDHYTNATRVDPASRRVLVGETFWYSDPNRQDPAKPRNTACPMLHESHGVGSLVFGQDGTLLVSCGDGASYNNTDLGPGSDSYYAQALSEGIILAKENVGAYRSQMVDSFSGKVIRIDPDTGDGIASNPFYYPAKPRSARSRVWALGLRNPYRFTLRPGTGSHDPALSDPGVFYLGDVGWVTYEDLNIIRAGGQNFGWPAFEGQTQADDYYNANVVNQDAPNPNNTCDRPYFYFRELIQQDTLGAPSWPNPCNSSLQITSAEVFLHSRPALDWQHDVDASRFAAFNGNNAVAWPVGSTAPDGTIVLGDQFKGNTSTGGVWYTGDDFPAQYKNTYFHGDYGSQWIRYFVFDSNNVPTEVRSFGDNIGGVVSIATHPQSGGLYYIAWTAFIRKVSYAPTTNVPPVAIATVDRTYGASPLTVQLSGAQSSDANGGTLTYTWDLGDGSPIATGVTQTHTYTATGVTNFSPTLTVKDSGDLSSQSTLLVSVNNTPPTATITSPLDGDLYSMSGPTTLNLSATLGDTETGGANNLCSWVTILHHNSHTHQDAANNNCSTTTVITPVGCGGETYYYELQLTVTDPQGLSIQSSSKIYPDCGPPIATSSATASAAHAALPEGAARAGEEGRGHGGDAGLPGHRPGGEAARGGEGQAPSAGP